VLGEVATPWQLAELRVTMQGGGSHSWSGAWEAVADGKTVGAGWMRTPLLDNPELAELDVHVLPALPRQHLLPGRHDQDVLAHAAGLRQLHEPAHRPVELPVRQRERARVERHQPPGAPVPEREPPLQRGPGAGAAPSTPEVMLGSTIRTITVNHPAPSDRAASLRRGASGATSHRRPARRAPEGASP